MSQPEGWALAAATAVLLAASPWAAWESAVLALAGAATGEPLVAWAGLIAGTGLGRLSALRIRRRALDRLDASAERFLERLRFVASTGLPLGPSIELALAGSAAQYRRYPTGASFDLGEWIESVWPHPVLRRARPVWAVLDRHGGPIADIAAALLAEVRLERQLRWELDHSLAGPLGTVAVLAWSPPAILAMFRWVVPSFYLSLIGTAPGELCLLFVATLTAVVVALAAALAVPAEARDKVQAGKSDLNRGGHGCRRFR